MRINWFIKTFLCCFCLATAGVYATALETNELELLDQTTKSRKHHTRSYYTFNYPSTQPGGQTLLTGIREVKHHSDKFYISGFYNSPNNGPVIPFVYKGNLTGKGTWNILNYPSSLGQTVSMTNLYGPNNGSRSTIQVVGNYQTIENGSSDIGCLYEGPLDGTGEWTTLVPPSPMPVLNTIAHSTMGGLVVGNYSTQPQVSQAFIYDIKNQHYYEIVKQNAKDVTAYGIWHNRGHSYTICGGYSDLDVISGIGHAYLVDWNNRSHRLSNWRTYEYNNDPINALETHFDGITSDGNGGYNLTGDWIGINQIIPQGFYCEIKKRRAKWSPIVFPGQLTTSGNSISRNIVIGSYLSPDQSVNGYISTSRPLHFRCND